MGKFLWPCRHKNCSLMSLLGPSSLLLVPLNLLDVLSQSFHTDNSNTVRLLIKHSFSHENMATIQSFHISVSSRGIQHQLSSYRETVIRQATASAGSAAHRDDAPTCGICHKTKFADGCGNLCSYCHTKFCARCGGRVSLRSNTVSCDGSSELYVVMWISVSYFWLFHTFWHPHLRETQ